MNKKEKALPLPLPPFFSLSLSIYLSFVLSPSSSLSLSNADVLHTLSNTNAPAFARHHRIQRQKRERNIHGSEKNVNIQEEKKKCAKLSLSLISPPSSSSLSSFHVGIHCHKHLGICPSGGGILMSQLSSPSQP